MGIMDTIGRFADSAIYAIAPKAGLKRIATRRARDLLEKNTKMVEKDGSTRRQRLRRRSFKQSSPNESRDSRYVTQDMEINSLLDEGLTDIQSRAVGLYSDNGIARSAVETRVAYEVGEGIRVKPMVKTMLGNRFLNEKNVKRINDEISELVQNWSECGVDRHRQLSYSAAQRLMVREFANEGECFVLLGDVPFAGKGSFEGESSLALEFISPRRVQTPIKYLTDEAVRLGIRYGSRGEIVGYYVLKRHPDDTLSMGGDDDFEYYPRFDSAGQPRMLHIFDPLFAGQTRGLPWLVSAMNKIMDLDDYHEAEIIGKQVEACFGLIFKMSTGDGAETLHDLAEVEAEEIVGDELMEKITPGFIQRMKEDDEVSVVDPSRPGSNFAPFLEGSLRMISAAAQIPYELLAKNFFQTTFASGRLSVLDGQMYFNMRRSILEDMGLNPIHKRIVHTAVFQNELYGTLPVEIYMSNPYWFHRRKYYCKSMGLIQPEREIASYIAGKEAGFLTKSDFHQNNGDDWEAAEEQEMTEAKREIDRRIHLEEYEMKLRESKQLPEKKQEANPDQKANRDMRKSLFDFAMQSVDQ